MTSAAAPAGASAPAGGQLIHVYTQEAVQFNPLLYVNTGVETAVQETVFSALWQVNDPQANIFFTIRSSTYQTCGTSVR